MRRFFTKLAGCTAVALTLFAASCTPDGPEVVTPNFPAPVTEEVVAGEIYTLTIEPNQAWTISIPEDAIYFTILDNENEVYSISGEKGTHEISFKVADIRDYDNSHSCDVTMTMGKSEQVIATLNLGKLIRSIEIYDIKLENNEWIYGEETQYEYESEPIGEDGVTLTWRENNLAMFSHRVKIVSNFNWKIDGTPEWIQAISNNTDDVTELWIKGNATKYPLEDSSATLSFLDADDSSVEVVATLKVQIASMTSIYEFSNFDESYKFNYKGEVYSELSSSYYEGNADGEVYSTNEELYAYTLSFETMNGMTFPTFGHDWISTEISEWDTQDEELIQSRNVSISVGTNEGADREAIVLIIPKSVADTFDDINEPYEVLEMAEGGMGASGELVEEYKKYVVTTIKQTAHPGPVSLTTELNTILMTKVDMNGNHDIVYDYETAQHGYELLYTSEYDSDDAMFAFDVANYTYTSIEYSYYDGSNLVPMSSDESWIKINTFGSAGGFRLRMEPTATSNKHYKTEGYYNGAYSGYAVFKNKEEVVAVINCLYNEGYSLNGEGDGNSSVAFSYPDYATSIDNSSLVQLTSGSHYETVIGDYGEIPVWHLTYTKTSATMSAITGIDGTWSFVYLNEDDREWLSFEPGDMATVSMAESGNGKTGILIFRNELMVPQMALVCTLNIAQ